MLTAVAPQATMGGGSPFSATFGSSLFRQFMIFSRARRPARSGEFVPAFGHRFGKRRGNAPRVHSRGNRPGAMALRAQLEKVREAVGGGFSLQDALARTDNFFPRFFHEMVAVGEQTGHAAEIFRHLAEHYDHQVRLKRAFLQSITWPMVQLAAALGIVGLVIWVTGFINGRDKFGKPIDILGFGLIGTPGLLVYLAVLATIAVAGMALYQATRRGMFWTGPVERGVLRIPVLGQALRTLALARLAWSLHLTYGVGMDLQRALELSLRSTQNRYYTDHCEEVVRSDAARPAD